MTLLFHFLKHIIMMSGLKMRNPMIWQEKLRNMPSLEGDEEQAKHGKGLKIFNQNITRLPIL